VKFLHTRDCVYSQSTAQQHALVIAHWSRHHEQQLDADTAFRPKFHNTKCWRTCTDP
jgi:hypothetical protein